MALVSGGFRVYAGVRTERDGLELSAAAPPHRLTPLHMDVTCRDTLVDACKTVIAAEGAAGIAGLVNNAGIFIGGPLEFLPLDDLRRQFEVNVFGQIAATQVFLPLLRSARGRVILMGSISGRIATPLLGPYAASKFALEALADSLRVELSFWSIPVSLIEPGKITTPLWEKTLSRIDDLLQTLPDKAADLYRPMIKATINRASWRSQTGLPPESVAKAIIHALTAPSPRARYLVGLDAYLQALLVWLMPDKVLDGLIRRSMGLQTGPQTDTP